MYFKNSQKDSFIKLAFFAGLLSGCFSQAFAKSTLIYGETGRLDRFDPYTVHEMSGQRMSDLLFDGLLSLDAGGQYVGKLAKSWKVSGDGTSVTFSLRQQVFWHAKDGIKQSELFTAEDVVSTVEALTSKSSSFPNKERFAVLGGAIQRSPFEVEVYFKRALSDPLKFCLFKILPSKFLGANPTLNRDIELAKNPIGTGPYIFKETNSRGEVILVANKNYFFGAPSIPRVIMKAFTDQNIMAQSLLFNSLDLMTYVSPRDLQEVQGDQNLTVLPYDGLSYSFFALNTKSSILSDRRVRMALSYAVNRKEMLKAFFNDKGKIISGPFPPTSWAYNLDVKPVEFDLNRAKRLLDAAEVKDANNDGVREYNGKPIKLRFLVPLAGESEMIKRIVLAFRSYLMEMGLQLDLKFMDWINWKNKVLRDRDYDITIASWNFDDASNITSLFHSSSIAPWGNNFVQFKNDEVDALLTEADATGDHSKKRVIYQKLHSILAYESPYIYLWTLYHHAAHRDSVQYVRVEPFAFFKHILSWKLKSI